MVLPGRHGGPCTSFWEEGVSLGAPSEGLGDCALWEWKERGRERREDVAWAMRL